MGDINDFFSPEALRLFEESATDGEEVFQLNDIPIDHNVATAPTDLQAQTPRERPHFPQRVPRCSTLSLEQFSKPKRKRAKFDITARKKVATVREKGACLRCRLLKITVGNSALNLQSTTYEHIVF